MCLSGGGKVRKREKSQHHVFLIKMVTLWKNNAGKCEINQKISKIT